MQKGSTAVSDDPDPSRKPDNRVFFLIAGCLGVLILICLVMVGYFLTCGLNFPCASPDPNTPEPNPPVPAADGTISITPLIVGPTFTPSFTPTFTVTVTSTISPTTAVPAPTTITPSPTTPVPNPTTITPSVTTAIPAPTTITPATNIVTPPPWFADLPEEYHEIEPPALTVSLLQQGAIVVPLPNETGSLREEIASVAPPGTNLSQLDFGRAVTFPTNSSDEYIAVPISQDFYLKSPVPDPVKGTFVGVLYDRYGSLAGVPDLYQVWAYDTYVALTGTKIKGIILQSQEAEYFWQPQKASSDLPLAFFVQGSCYFCWRIDGRCGCLVCKNRRR